MRARKRFGQHFLEPAWARKLVEAVDPLPRDVFLEIGPGRGALTLPLAARVERIIAVEVDRDLARELRGRLPVNVELVEADFLEAEVAGLLGPGTIRAVGNLPYNLSTPILFRLLELAGEGRSIKDATLMLQREVAQRLAARPGTRTWGVLSACQRLRATVTPVLDLPPGAFRPAPRVHSSVVRLQYHPAEPAVDDPGLFDSMVRAIFSQRRKVLDNALEGFAGARGVDAAEAIRAAGLDGRRRPETLDLRELAALARVFAVG